MAVDYVIRDAPIRNLKELQARLIQPRHAGSIALRYPQPGLGRSQTAALAFGKVHDKLPVRGSGVIGVEMAALHNAVGSTVTIVEAQERDLAEAK